MRETGRVEIPVEDVRSSGRTTVTVDGTSVVVFALGERFVAYVDVCPHQGGPVCSDGSMHPFLTAEIDQRGRVSDVFAPGGDRIIACPWHGWEYWIEDGRCVADPSTSLREAAVDVVDGNVVVTLRA